MSLCCSVVQLTFKWITTVFVYFNVSFGNFKVSVLVETLEKHLDSPSVSPSVVIKVVSNLMDSNPEALSKSANRFNTHVCLKTNKENNIYTCKCDFFPPDVCVVFLGDRLIHLVDDLGVKLAVTGGDGILSTSSLVVAVKTVNGSNFTTILFDVFNTDYVQVVICSSRDIGPHMRAFF